MKKELLNELSLDTRMQYEIANRNEYLSERKDYIAIAFDSTEKFDLFSIYGSGVLGLLSVLLILFKIDTTYFTFISLICSFLVYIINILGFYLSKNVQYDCLLRCDLQYLIENIKNNDTNSIKKDKEKVQKRIDKYNTALETVSILSMIFLGFAFIMLMCSLFLG